MKKHTTDEFILLSEKKHGKKYSYSKVIYKNLLTKVTIICSIHGEFEQIPSNHLLGRGCKKCAVKNNGYLNRSNNENFILKSLEIHNSAYDYSKTKYVTSDEKVIITCKLHGDFEKMPTDHLNGQGCPKCGYLRISIALKDSLEEFINKAKVVHNNFYDYSKVSYFNSRNKITIICPEHGEFQQQPNNHLNGKGCPSCNKGIPFDLEEFIIRSNIIHKDRYDYSKVIYVNCKSKVIIKCSIHGEFNQTPASHLQGHGCPICKASKGEILIRNILIKYNINFIQEYIIPNVTPRYRYDFYLPDYNILIEFHGIQHYKSIPFFGGNEGLRLTKERDLFKNELAKLSKMSILYFNYKQLKELSYEKFEFLIIGKIDLVNKRKAPPKINRD